VPDSTTVLLTITAPIRLPAKTAAALEVKIPMLLERGSPARDEKDTIHGNCVQIRIVRGGVKQAPKFIGFVHNPDSDELLLLNVAQELLGLISAQTGRRKTRPAGDRWLLLISAGGNSRLEAYRYICSQLRMAAEFEKILILVAGRVEVLSG
jgi:hypothetical protein